MPTDLHHIATLRLNVVDGQSVDDTRLPLIEPECLPGRLRSSITSV